MSRNSVLYLKSRKCIGKPVRFLFVLVLPYPLARALIICSERGGDVSNEKNLVPFTERTESEQRAIQQKGGIASGAARRRKRSLKEAADVYLSLPVADRRRWNKLVRRCIDPEDIDNQMAMIVGLTEAATAGDARAATVIVKLLGEETPREDTGADQLTRAAELLEGIDGVIE
jgi:hypothetical protein|nr:MAG TPA: hypothetical protein [Caudoviricetes sp.]